MNGNYLTVIENGQISTYDLNNKTKWLLGRPSKENTPDIKMYSPTISRKHGELQNIDGVWFYYERSGKNGTVFRGKHLTSGINKRVKPMMLQDGDVFVFGGGEEAVINSKTVWARYSDNDYDGQWNVADVKNHEIVAIVDEDEITTIEKPPKGTVIEKNNGVAICMGDIVYMKGCISVIGK